MGASPGPAGVDRRASAFLPAPRPRLHIYPGPRNRKRNVQPAGEHGEKAKQTRWKLPLFGSEDELLYLYEVGVYPPVRFSQAIRTLRHPLMSELNDDFTTVVDRVTGYIAEARQRAEEVGHVFTETDEESLGEDLQTAESIDAGIITKEEATAMRPSKFLATYNS